MKPAPFDYYAPATLDEALSLLGTHGYDAKILAGGQSLLPTMNFRLAMPSVLVDLNRIEALDYIRAEGNNLFIGAMTRQSSVEQSPLIAQHAPLLREAIPHIAHVQIRNRGTFGGSLAHADPAAELPALALALGMRMRVRSASRERWIDAPDFYTGLFSTALEPNEILVEVAIPPIDSGTGWAFEEMARRHGDYAIVGVCALTRLDSNQNVNQCRLVFLGVGEGPVEAKQAEAFLTGSPLTATSIQEAADLAAESDLSPSSDIHASAAYRRHLARVLTRRALTRSQQRMV